VFPFGEGKVALFRKFTLSLGGIDFCIRRFFSGDFLDPSIWIVTWTLSPLGEVMRPPIEAPVLIKISGFIYKCCQCGGLGCDLNNLLMK
jgi:hypothetical protein